MNPAPPARTWSLRRRLAWRMTLGAGAVLALLFVLLDVLIDREIYAHFDQGLALRADVISLSMQRHGVDIPLPDYQENGHTEFFTVYGARGEVLLTSPNSRGIALPAGPRDAALPRYFDARLPDGHASAELVCGEIALDTRQARATVGGQALTLTSHEFRVLDYLMHHPGQVVSRSDLIEHIYAQDFDRDSNTVEVFIARLRKKLPEGVIETVRGLGYRLVAQ